MKNIHILPTNKPSRLFIDIDNDKLTITNNPIGGEHFMNQNVYFTNDEEIKEGDWFIAKNKVLLCTQVTSNIIASNTSNGGGFSYSQSKKIILTTDQDLIKDGVQTIDDEFLEWFVKNPSFEEVKIERGVYRLNSDGEKIGFPNMSLYKIIILKEKPCEYFTPTIGCIKDICSCNKEPKKAPFKHKVESLSTEEVLANKSSDYEFIDFDKQEILEEVAEKYVGFYRGSAYRGFINGFKNGAKWQQERSYSEEDMKSAFKVGFSIGYGSDVYAIDEKNRTCEEFIEQFKKK